MCSLEEKFAIYSPEYGHALFWQTVKLQTKRNWLQKAPLWPIIVLPFNDLTHLCRYLDVLYDPHQMRPPYDDLLVICHLLTKLIPASSLQACTDIYISQGFTPLLCITNSNPNSKSFLVIDINKIYRHLRLRAFQTAIGWTCNSKKQLIPYASIVCAAFAIVFIINMFKR